MKSNLMNYTLLLDYFADGKTCKELKSLIQFYSARKSQSQNSNPTLYELNILMRHLESQRREQAASGVQLVVRAGTIAPLDPTHHAVT